MLTTRSIAIYGDTLALAGIALALERHPNWKVITLEEANLAQQLNARSPDVIIFDQSQTDAQSILASAEQCRDLLAIGIEANSNRMILWSGHSARALTIQDLTQAIDALPESIHRLAVGDQSWQSISNRLPLRLTRRQRLALAILTIGLGLDSLLGLTTSIASEIWLSFGVGAMIGGAVIGMYFWMHGKNHRKEG